ncbi:MAG: universal stress protein [Ilumatobacter sp.]
MLRLTLRSKLRCSLPCPHHAPKFFDANRGKGHRGPSALTHLLRFGHEWSHAASLRHATTCAATQARQRAAELFLQAAWPVPISTSMTPMSATTAGATIDAVEQSAQAVLDDVANELESSSEVHVARCVSHGGAAALLLEAARQAELLVGGRRGHGGFARLALGSTSTQCGTRSSVPVAVIPADSTVVVVASIVVAFDGSTNSVAALRWAHSFAAAGSVITCVCVWDTSPIAVGADQFFFPEAFELAQERFGHLVDATLGPITRRDITVRRAFVHGRPRMVLADFASRGDLLVTGARGNGAVGAALLGSVSTWLLHHVHRPMVIVPTSDTANENRAVAH